MARSRWGGGGGGGEFLQTLDFSADCQYSRESGLKIYAIQPAYTKNFAKHWNANGKAVKLLQPPSNMEEILRGNDFKTKTHTPLDTTSSPINSHPINSSPPDFHNTVTPPISPPPGYHKTVVKPKKTRTPSPQLDPYSACPDDDVPARIITSCTDELSAPLHILWLDSLNSGFIPPVLKTQFITPVYKKDDRTDPANYRPVSLTSHIIKTFERIMRDELVSSQPS